MIANVKSEIVKTNLERKSLIGIIISFFTPLGILISVLGLTSIKNGFFGRMLFKTNFMNFTIELLGGVIFLVVGIILTDLHYFWVKFFALPKINYDRCVRIDE